MEKVRYETDPHNRLVIGFRQVLDGEFKVGADNSLSYHVKAPLDDKAATDRQIKLNGKWSLDKNHDLVFTLDAWERQVSGDELTLRCQIIDADKNTLVASMTTRSADGNASVYMLKLQGAWQADKHNRLTFCVNTCRARPDILIFDAAWEINKNYELLYRFQKEGLVRGQRTTQSICFKGHWDIRDKARLTYILGAATGSGFEFKTSVGVFKDKYIKYELGIGSSGKRSIVFSGSWKIKPSLGLVFEIEKDGGALGSIAFSAQARLSSKDAIIFSLKDRLDRDLGAELELSRKIAQGNGEAFIRLLAAKGEQGVYIGMGRQW